jgi:CubicO group peptidase (beta-lactamase class C family)
MNIRWASIVLVAVWAVGPAAGAFEWETATPESQGLSKEKLEALREDLAKHGTEIFLVVRHDKIVMEWYAPEWSAEKPHGTASLAKATIAGLSLAVAMQDGKIKASDPAANYVAEWRNDPKKSKITVAQLGMHTSGLADAEDAHNTPHDKLTGWEGEFWKREPRDPFTISRDQTPVINEPGQRISYSNPGIAMLTYAVTAAEGQDVRTLLRDRVFRPIGIGDKEWSAGYGKTYRSGGLDLVGSWGGAAFTARAAARIGRLMLREGDWDGKQLLAPAVVRECTMPPANLIPDNEWEGINTPRPGYGWWTNRAGVWKTLPRDAFAGAGAQHQILIVIPSLDMIVVRNGRSLDASTTFWQAAGQRLLQPLGETVVDPPVKASDVIRRVRFDEEIIRKALDSDNWPLTWADDGQLYTSYGDGSGFEPFIEKKLSMGIARVEGTPPDFRGINLRSESIERTGNGPKGPKASGILMVDGVLYMWVRNTHNATLTWSADHGKSWTWGFTFDESFGCPALLNFGQNYAGAPDDYVYTYSQDGPSAYEPYDGVVLARVPKSRVQDRTAYEFFTKRNDDGSASWSADIASRGHVLHYPGHCERLDVVYDAGIGRYLMAVSFGHGKGWGLFDSAHPWGPWTSAFITRDWGLGDTHGYRLPSKWISADGKSLWLVFSGRTYQGVMYDAFCVRRMRIETY